VTDRSLRRRVAIGAVLVLAFIALRAVERSPSAPLGGPSRPALPPATALEAPRTTTPLVSTPTPKLRPTRTPSTPAASSLAAPFDQTSMATTALTLRGIPTVKPAFVNAVLAREASPLAGLGTYIDAQGRKEGIDPVFLLAFVTAFDLPHALSPALHNVGHLSAVAGQPSQDGFRQFATWRDGVDAWYSLMRGSYIGQWNLSTLDAVIPVYAPGPAAKIEDEVNTLHALVTSWRGSSAV